MRIHRYLVLAALLGGAVGIPYLFYQDRGQPTSLGVATLWSETPNPARLAVSDGSSSGGENQPADADNPSGARQPGMPQVTHFNQVFRMDVTPRWVTGNWHKVSGALSTRKLSALRVPLVTGTRVDDLAGSLTFYFDEHHRVQRLTFDGFTGDERRFVLFATEQFGLKPEPHAAGRLYLRKWGKRPISGLFVALAPVAERAPGHNRFEVAMEINVPTNYFSMSEEFLKKIE